MIYEGGGQIILTLVFTLFELELAGSPLDQVQSFCIVFERNFRRSWLVEMVLPIGILLCFTSKCPEIWAMKLSTQPVGSDKSSYSDTLQVLQRVVHAALATMSIGGNETPTSQGTDALLSGALLTEELRGLVKFCYCLRM